MKALNLSGLIKGLMIVIGIATALGKLEILKQWAAQQAFHAQNTTQSLKSKAR